jgi:hypothetical protein
LPRREPRAFAQSVADIAEHEQVAERGAREAHEIVRLAGDETAREAAGFGRRTVLCLDGDFDPFGKIGGDRNLPIAREFDKTFGELGVLRR